MLTVSPRSLVVPVVSLLRPLYQLLYPPICFGCDRLLADDERRVCAACWQSIRRLTDDNALYHVQASRLKSEGCLKDLVSCYVFEKEGVLQVLMHKLKYYGMTSLGLEMGRRLGESVVSQVDPRSVAGLIAVPLHRVKLRERGYNQSDFIARGVSDVTGLPVLARILERRRYTKSQTQLDAQERKENVLGAFSVSPSSISSIRERTFLIIDDVITTGATIEACAHVLVERGANGVIACAVALADRPSLP